MAVKPKRKLAIEGEYVHSFVLVVPNRQVESIVDLVVCYMTNFAEVSLYLWDYLGSFQTMRGDAYIEDI